jgi:hypothetical protein
MGGSETGVGNTPRSMEIQILGGLVLRQKRPGKCRS